MTPGVAVGMGRSIRARSQGKNRWIGKAIFTASHESAISRWLWSVSPFVKAVLPPSFIDG